MAPLSARDGFLSLLSRAAHDITPGTLYCPFIFVMLKRQGRVFAHMTANESTAKMNTLKMFMTCLNFLISNDVIVESVMFSNPGG